MELSCCHGDFREIYYEMENHREPVSTGFTWKRERNDFTRKQVFTMEKIIDFILSMQGDSLKKELYEAGVDVTAAAFVQQQNHSAMCKIGKLPNTKESRWDFPSYPYPTKFRVVQNLLSIG